MGRFSSWKENATAWGYLTGWKVVARLPLPVARGLFHFGADLACRWGHGAPQLQKNLQRVVGAKAATPDLVRQSMRSYARYWLEAFRLPRLAGDATTLDTYEAGIRGLDRLEQAIAAGNGVVLILPHTGNWDMAGMYLAHRFRTFTTVAERLKPEALYDAFVDYRESLGFRVLPLTGGQPAFPQLRETLQRGEIVCLLGERDLRRHGIPVEFFGEPTRMPAGAAKLARDTGATLLVVHSWFQGNGWGTSISEPVAHLDDAAGGLEAMVQHIANVMEDNIRQHPTDWHMLQPLWISDLDQERYQRGLQEPAAGKDASTDTAAGQVSGKGDATCA